MRVVVLYLLFALSHIQVAGHTSCSSVFLDKEEEFLNLAIKAEMLIGEMYKVYSANVNGDIVRLSVAINQQISSIFEGKIDFSESALFELKQNIKKIEEALNGTVDLSNKKPLDLSYLIQHLDIIQADVSYRIDWPDHPPVYAIFSQRIVDTFFHPKKDIKHYLAIGRKKLKALQSGYTAGKESSNGIKLLTLAARGHPNNQPYSRNKIFEVKTVGKLSGHIRWGGFKDGNILYIIHYSYRTHYGKHRTSFITTLQNKYQDHFLLLQHGHN